MGLMIGLEPTTRCLQNSCATIAPHQHCGQHSMAVAPHPPSAVASGAISILVRPAGLEPATKLDII